MKECAQNVYLWLAANTVIQAFLCVQIHQSGNGRAWSLWDRVEAAPMSREITTLAMLFSSAVKYVNLFVPRVIPCQHCLLKTSNLTPAKTIESSKGNHVLTFVLTGLCSTFMCLPLLPYFCVRQKRCHRGITSRAYVTFWASGEHTSFYTEQIDFHSCIWARSLLV